VWLVPNPIRENGSFTRQRKTPTITQFPHLFQKDHNGLFNVPNLQILKNGERKLRPWATPPSLYIRPTPFNTRTHSLSLPPFSLNPLSLFLTNSPFSPASLRYPHLLGIRRFTSRSRGFSRTRSASPFSPFFFVLIFFFKFWKKIKKKDQWAIIWCCSWTVWYGPCRWWSRWPSTRSSPPPSPRPPSMRPRQAPPAPLRWPRTTATTRTRCCCPWRSVAFAKRRIASTI